MNSDGNKFFGEKLLLEDVSNSPIFATLLRNRSVLSKPEVDPFLENSDKSYISQWVASPIRKNGRLLGWVVISFNWTQNFQQLLNKSEQKLKSAYLPIQGLRLSSEENNKLSISVNSADTNNDVMEASKLLQLGLANYKLSIQFDRPTALASANKIQTTIITLILIASVLLCFSMFALLRQAIIRPIMELIKHINILGYKDLNYEIPPLQSKELSLISNSINNLSSHLKRKTTSIDQLDKEIKEKERVMAM